MMRQVIIFCADPLLPRSVDADYLEEWQAAQAAGFETVLINYKVLRYEHAATQAIQLIQGGERAAAIYRGWDATGRSLLAVLHGAGDIVNLFGRLTRSGRGSDKNMGNERRPDGARGNTTERRLDLER